jgi:hypothetical protein
VGNNRVSKATSVLLTSMLLGSGCMPHVALPEVLPRTAPLPMRRAQYESFRPMHTETVITSTGGYYGPNGYQPGSSSMSTRTTLANGTPVYYSEDLFPLVGPNSRSWGHTETARTLESTSTWTTVASIPLVGLGVTFLFLGPSLRWDSGTTLGVSIPFLAVGALSGLAGGITRYIAGWQRRDAFLTFDEDFRNNLGLCLGAMGLGECAPSPLPINDGSRQVPPPPPSAAIQRPMLRF